MKKLKIMTDRNVCLNFQPSRVDHGNGKGGPIRISIEKDALSSLIRENQSCILILEDSRRVRGRIREIITGAAENDMTLSLKIGGLR